MNELFDKINTIIQKVDRRTLSPSFFEEKNKRQDKIVLGIISDNEFLRTLTYLIAYSQNANSELVEQVIANGDLDNAFKNFNLNEVVKLNPCDIADEYWSSLKGIRQQSKLFHIVSLARTIQRIGNLSIMISNANIPQQIVTNDDIVLFWKGFDRLQKLLQAAKVPFFQSTTSLLHLLMEMGYDCVKPDLVVMKVAKEIGIIDDGIGDKELKEVVRTIQNYAINKRVRPSVVDLYFLIYGGQKGALKYVNQN